MGKVLIWFVIIISTVVLYCLMKVKAESDELYEELMADYDTWKKVGRYVKRGAKGCAIFPSRALNPHMRYIFDISDTGGKNVKLTWDLEGENLKD